MCAQAQRFNVPSISSLPQPALSSWTILEREKAFAWKAHRIEDHVLRGCWGELLNSSPVAACLVSRLWQVAKSLTTHGCLIRPQQWRKALPSPSFLPDSWFIGIWRRDVSVPLKQTLRQGLVGRLLVLGSVFKMEIRVHSHSGWWVLRAAGT